MQNIRQKCVTKPVVVSAGVVSVKLCIQINSRLQSVADPGGGGAKGAMAPPSVPDKDYLLCTSWHFLFKKTF